MKFVIPLLVLFISVSASAGDYYQYQTGIDIYDPITGLYYKAVRGEPETGGFLSSKTSGRAAVNINIFDPASGQSKLLFEQPQKKGIPIFLFESGYEDGAVKVFGTAGPGFVSNNAGVQKRNPRDKLLVGVRSEAGTLLFVSSKRGIGLKKIATVPTAADWHLDTKNSKLRIVHQTGNGVRIESFEW